MKYLFFCSLFFLSSLCAVNEPCVERFSIGFHQYICFNDTQFIHDPDCPCSIRMRGYAFSKDQQVLNIELFRAWLKRDDILIKLP